MPTTIASTRAQGFRAADASTSRAAGGTPAPRHMVVTPAAREGSWTLPTIDTKQSIRSLLGPIGPVVVFGPNNFPLAFNSASGGDFAAAHPQHIPAGEQRPLPRLVRLEQDLLRSGTVQLDHARRPAPRAGFLEAVDH